MYEKLSVDDRKYWLGFSLVPEIGPKRLALLLHGFGDLRAAWGASESQLRHAGLDNQPTLNLLRARAALDLDKEIDRVQRVGARLLTLADDDYPPLLRTLPDAPAVLYVRGMLTPTDQRALSIVGTRKATNYGRDAAYHLAKQLAECGVTVVSGMAHGIDAHAHRGALDNGGRTLAVLGCGIDVIYPSDHAELAREIAQHGALVSEFPMGTRPEGRNFPRRNRLLSGIALGVLVIEAPEQSGALITAEAALEQGREVFAVPGNIFNPMCRGSNRLIQDGAKLVIDVSDILDELDIAYTFAQTRTTAEQIAPANETEAKILQHLNADPTHVDDLSRLCALPVSVVSSTLTLMELKGVVQMAGHMQYCLIRPR